VSPLTPELSQRLILVAWLVASTAVGFFVFPGHTILQSDTQIYLPILEHLWDPAVLQRDLIATRPHVAFTIYDEVALGLRRITGLSFEFLLMTQQFFYRLLGLFGLYLLGRACGLERPLAALASSLAALGAAILGPAVLTVEYEPVPRGFALAFIGFSWGALARSIQLNNARWRSASAASAGIALLWHPNTALPYWGLLLMLVAWKRRWASAIVLLSAPVLLAVLAIPQRTLGESQPLFGIISPQLEALQRMRAAYNWVSVWIGDWWLHYVLVWIAGLLAYRVLRDRLSPELRFLFSALPAIGLLSVPLSWVLTEKAKWILMPQFQPGRYLVYTTLVAVILSAFAAMVHARRLNRIVFLLFVLLVPSIPNLGKPNWTDPWTLWRMLLSLGIAVSLVLMLRAPRAAWAFTIVPALAISLVGGVRNYPPLHTPELNELARWARQQTSPDAVFQFAGVGRGLQPGVFRARSLRALYADWKSGGQVNFHPEFAELWRERWEQVREPQSLDRYRELGIDYAVFPTPKRPAGATPIYSNAEWAVYRLK
jgi:hypothetical protein